jgi:hypothetical protein
MILKAGGFPTCDGDDLEFLTKPKAHPFSPFVELRKVERLRRQIVLIRRHEVLYQYTISVFPILIILIPQNS